MPHTGSPSVVILLLAVAACGGDGEPATQDAPPAAARAGEAAATSDASPVVEVTMRDFALDVPERIPSGWVTLAARNVGAQEHFIYVYRLPDGISFEEYQAQALVPFGEVWGRYASGALPADQLGAAFAEEMPAWYFTDLVPAGGVAILEPGESARSTVHLEPGTYVAECYVKAPDGSWHTELGMITPFAVTEDPSGGTEPAPDVTIELRNYAIGVDGAFRTGPQVVAVRAVETPDGFMKHDLNLFRLEDGQQTGEIVEWMNWMDLEQFRAPAPGHSLGGMEHLAAGRTGYVHLDLEPGRYAWVSEGYGARGMVHEFEVTD